MNAKLSFLVRQVVRLAAGGPEMIVEGPAAATGHVWCTWSIGRFFHGGSFDEAKLIRVERPVEEYPEPLDRRYYTPLVDA